MHVQHMDACTAHGFMYSLTLPLPYFPSLIPMSMMMIMSSTRHLLKQMPTVTMPTHSTHSNAHPPAQSTLPPTQSQHPPTYPHRVAEELARALVPCLSGATDTLPNCLQQVQAAAHALVHGTTPALVQDVEQDAALLPKDTRGLQAALVALADRLQAGQGLAHQGSTAVEVEEAVQGGGASSR